MKPRWRACPRSRANGLPLPPTARARPVNGGGHGAEYGCRAEGYGIRANRMPNPKRSEIELSMLEKGWDLKFYKVRFAHSHSPESEPSTTHKCAYSWAAVRT